VMTAMHCATTLVLYGRADAPATRCGQLTPAASHRSR
jgi:hypothetical protein